MWLIFEPECARRVHPMVARAGRGRFDRAAVAASECHAQPRRPRGQSQKRVGHEERTRDDTDDTPEARSAATVLRPCWSPPLCPGLSFGELLSLRTPSRVSGGCPPQQVVSFRPSPLRTAENPIGTRLSALRVRASPPAGGTFNPQVAGSIPARAVAEIPAPQRRSKASPLALEGARRLPGDNETTVPASRKYGVSADARGLPRTYRRPT